MQRHLIAEHKVHVLGGNPIEGGLVYFSMGDLAEISDANLEQDHEAVSDRRLQLRVEGEFRRRQKRFTSIRKGDRRDLRSDRGDRRAAGIGGSSGQEESKASAFLLCHRTRDAKSGQGPAGSSARALSPARR